METLVYLLKSTLILSLFFGVYEFFLKRETLFKHNRIFLITGILVAAFLPAITWTNNAAVNSFIPQATLLEPIHTTSLPQQLSLENILLYTYGGVVLFFVGRFCIKLWHLHRLLQHSNSETRNGIHYIKTTAQTNPFSFFNTIVYNPELHNSEERTHILAHEQAHVNHLHSLDIILGNLMTYFNWFNPLVWLYRKRINQNLEFLADHEVTKSMASSKPYQLSLLNCTATRNMALPVNNFYQSFLKTRIMMLHQQKSNKFAFIKAGLVLPFIAVFFLAFQVETMAQVKEPPTPPTPDTSVATPPTPPNIEATVVDTKVYPMASIGQKPKFPGNIYQYIGKQLNYPKAAKEAGIGGRVYVKFTIERNGNVSHVTVIRGEKLGHGLPEEAVRVVKGMPDWTPGKVEGKPVRVSYILPLVFSVDKSTSSTEKNKSTEKVEQQ